MNDDAIDAVSDLSVHAHALLKEAAKWTSAVSVTLSKLRSASASSRPQLSQDTEAAGGRYPSLQLEIARLREKAAQSTESMRMMEARAEQAEAKALKLEKAHHNLSVKYMRVKNERNASIHRFWNWVGCHVSVVGLEYALLLTQAWGYECGWDSSNRTSNSNLQDGNEEQCRRLLDEFKASSGVFVLPTPPATPSAPLPLPEWQPFHTDDEGEYAEESAGGPTSHSMGSATSLPQREPGSGRTETPVDSASGQRSNGKAKTKKRKKKRKCPDMVLHDEDASKHAVQAKRQSVATSPAQLQLQGAELPAKAYQDNEVHHHPTPLNEGATPGTGSHSQPSPLDPTVAPAIAALATQKSIHKPASDISAQPATLPLKGAAKTPPRVPAANPPRQVAADIDPCSTDSTPAPPVQSTTAPSPTGSNRPPPSGLATLTPQPSRKKVSFHASTKATPSPFPVIPVATACPANISKLLAESRATKPWLQYTKLSSFLPENDRRDPTPHDVAVRTFNATLREFWATSAALLWECRFSWQPDPDTLNQVGDAVVLLVGQLWLLIARSAYNSDQGNRLVEFLSGFPHPAWPVMTATFMPLKAMHAMYGEATLPPPPSSKKASPKTRPTDRIISMDEQLQWALGTTFAYVANRKLTPPVVAKLADLGLRDPAVEFRRMAEVAWTFVKLKCPFPHEPYPFVSVVVADDP
ncbi:hypothetical protein B5M09_004773 [Aphanomyces astaci]|uniref:Uncharacterized protein n=1 Tax=Aphanomyces astaci TaxID=112090 RepID=A0A425DE58_APHAT|nr:hypothetical protein B5M09_004773 [Aphanomyces astaci]